ncbi:uncharacterized protein LOC143586288 [Bidens hawaiensis]|uniref:uncharacterized protein LOC143586288 n=1 Tax=Bidens hawaiensis TaxID=980011 RepID=UPI00404AB683
MPTTRAKLPPTKKQYDTSDVGAAIPEWAIDITGPFSEAPGRVKFLIVSIDYFTIWIEAKSLATIIVASVKMFTWEFIIFLFGLPMNIFRDNGTQFADHRIKAWLSELNINQMFTSVAHPQGNG